MNTTGADIAWSNATLTPDFTFPNNDVNQPNTSAVAHHSGLSTGAKAGIAVGVIVLVAMLLGLLFVGLRKCRARTNPDFGAADGKIRYQRPLSYPMKDLEGSVSHEELVKNAAKPATGFGKIEVTPSVSVVSLRDDRL
jgi:hypothetical protein